MADNQQQPWLISYEYRPVEVAAFAGRIDVRSGDLAKTVALINMPPWKFLAMQRAKCQDADKIVPGTRLVHAGDDISAVFWAVQVPIGGLTDEERDLLS